MVLFYSFFTLLPTLVLRVELFSSLLHETSRFILHSLHFSQFFSLATLWRMHIVKLFMIVYEWEYRRSVVLASMFVQMLVSMLETTWNLCKCNGIALNTIRSHNRKSQFLRSHICCWHAHTHNSTPFLSDITIDDDIFRIFYVHSISVLDFFFFPQ